MFIDMKKNSYSDTDLDAVDFVCAIGTMTGYPDGSFHPEENLSNAEMCSILTRLFVSIPAETEKSVFYKDHWAARYIAWVEDQLSKNKRLLWFNEKNLNSSLSCKKVDELFRFFFEPLIQPDCWPNEAALDETGNATRLKVAYKIFYFCLHFFYQIEEYNIMELLEFWKSSFVNPYRLLLNISATGMVKTPNLKDSSNKKVLYKLTLLKDIEPIQAPDIYKELNTIDKIEAQCREVFTLSCGNAYHYTSLDALYQMLTKSKECLEDGNIGIKMFMGNAEYLNDPKEGQYFDETTSSDSERSDNILHPKDTYVLSLTKDKEERLPLWVQYGANGTGCRIEFEISKSDDFHDVLYIDSDANLNAQAGSAIQALKKYIKKQQKPVISNYAKEVIAQMKYYIKPIFYEYEAEIRHFSSSLPQYSNVYPSPRPGEVVPRLYCELNKALKVKSIMLGPKCQNPNHIALFLYRCGVPEVRMSRIEFK